MGAASIGLALFGFNTVIDYGNTKLLDRKLDNYARDVASVALRSELAITEKMDNKTLTADVVNQVLSQKMTLEGDDKDLEIKLTFGKILDGQFAACNEYPEEEERCTDPANPKSDQHFVEFSVVAVQLWSQENSFYGFVPQGRAIYGISEEDASDDTDLANCFCDKRYESCLIAEGDTGLYVSPATPPSTPLSLSAIMGTPNSEERKNYCEYGYVESHPGDTNKTKYPSVELSSQWLGKDQLDDGTQLIDFDDASQKGNFDVVSNQQPLGVDAGVNPFPTKSWSFWGFNWFSSSADYYAKHWDGTDLKDSEYNVGAYSSEYEIDNGCCFSPDYVLVDGYFYVGRTGTCVKGTSASDVPNVSGGLNDITNVADDISDAEVARCLSYEKTVGTITEQVACSMMEMMMNPDCWDGTKTVSTDINGYAQQSCIDFNSNSKTRMNFFQWMMSLFFSPFTSWDDSYKQLDCSVKKMRYFTLTIPFFGSFTWEKV